MATNAEFEPWEFHDGDAIVGIDPEIAGAIAEKLGMELKVEDMPSTPSSRLWPLESVTLPWPA